MDKWYVRSEKWKPRIESANFEVRGAKCEVEKEKSEARSQKWEPVSRESESSESKGANDSSICVKRGSPEAALRWAKRRGEREDKTDKR